MKNLAYLKKPCEVSFSTLYLDPNNPRLAPETPPGYHDVAVLTHQETQEELQRRVDDRFGARELADAIVGQGWMEIDTVVIYQHPADPRVNVVLEGNRRVTSLRIVRARLADAEKRLTDIK